MSYTVIAELRSYCFGAYRYPNLLHCSSFQPGSGIFFHALRHLVVGSNMWSRRQVNSSMWHQWKTRIASSIEKNFDCFGDPLRAHASWLARIRLCSGDTVRRFSENESSTLWGFRFKKSGTVKKNKNAESTIFKLYTSATGTLVSWSHWAHAPVGLWAGKLTRSPTSRTSEYP